MEFLIFVTSEFSNLKNFTFKVILFIGRGLFCSWYCRAVFENRIFVFSLQHYL